MTYMKDTEKNMEKNGIASSVLSRITAEGVVPTPRSHFLLREGVIWSLGGVSVILGALGVAAILFTARYSEWEYYDATHDTFVTFLVDIMPYTWIFALILFAVLAYESVRHTKHGYRYQVPLLVLGAVGASAALGSVVFALGAGPFIDKQIGSYIPLHNTLRDTQIGFWNQPERGIISGVVTEISPLQDEFTLRSPSNVLHTIRMDTLPLQMRRLVVTGETMRVFATLVEEEDVAFVDVGDAAAASSMQAADADMSLMASNPAGESGATSVIMKTAPNPAVSMDASSVATFAQEESVPARRTKTFHREACLVLPFHDGDDADEDDYRDSVRDCLKDMRKKKNDEKNPEREEKRDTSGKREQRERDDN